MFDIVCASNGAFTSTALTQPIDGELIAIETNPAAGAVAPQDDYDITITDAEGLDVLQSCALNRDTANTEMAAIVFGTYFHPVVSLSDTLTLAISGNNVDSAAVKIKLYYR